MSEMNQVEKLRDCVRGGFVGAFIGERLGQVKQTEAGHRFPSPDMNGWRRIEMQTELILKHGVGKRASEETNQVRCQVFEGQHESPGATLATVVTLGLGLKLTWHAIGIPKQHDRPKIDLPLAFSFIAGLDAVSQDSAERKAPEFMLEHFYEKAFSDPSLLRGEPLSLSEVNKFLESQPDGIFPRAMRRLTKAGVLKDMFRSVDEFDKDMGIALGSATQIACQSMALCCRANNFELGINDLLNYGIHGMHTSLVGSVAGGFLGTHTGFSTIPREWLEQHLDHERAFELADKFFDAFIK